jgi:hypothetical protein
MSTDVFPHFFDPGPPVLLFQETLKRVVNKFNVVRAAAVIQQCAAWIEQLLFTRKSGENKF